MADPIIPSDQVEAVALPVNPAQEVTTPMGEGLQVPGVPTDAQPQDYAQATSDPESLFPEVEIEPIKLTEEEEKDLVKQVTKWYNDDSQSPVRVSYLSRCEEYHRAYLGEMPATSFPWPDSSNIDLGIIEMAVDNIKARYKMSTIGGKPAFLAVPRTPGAESIKDDVQELMSAALDQQVDIDKKVDRIAFDTVELGNCVTKRRWKKEKKKVRAFQGISKPVGFSLPFMSQMAPPVTLTQFKMVIQEVIEEMAEIDIVSVADILVPENSPLDPRDMHHIMHLYNLEESDLDSFFEQDKTYDKNKLEELKKYFAQQEVPKEEPRKDPNAQQPLPSKTLRCAEIYTKMKLGNMEYPEEVIISYAIDANVVFRVLRLIDVYFDGVRPFNWFRYKDSGNVWGRGVVEMLFPYRTALNSIFNMSVNCMMLQIMPWGFYRYGSTFKPDDHRLSPGIWIPLDDINDARPMTFPATARLADSSIMLLIQLVERQSGISAPHMGQQTSGRKTAFEIKAVISEGNIKHEERIDSFQAVFSDLLRGLFNLYKFNLPDNQVFRKLYDLQGNSLKSPVFFKPANRYILSQYDFDFVITGTLTTGNKSIERQDTAELAAILEKFPIVAENPDAQSELVRDILTAFGRRDFDRFLPPKEVTALLKNMKVQELLNLAKQQKMEQAGMRPPAPGGQPMPQGGMPNGQ